MKEFMTLTYASSLTDFCEFNNSFDRGALAVAYPGVNQNKSNITKSAFEKAIKSMYNVPVVCHYMRDEDKLGGHDMDVVTNSAGDLELINLTEPVGVVPESAKQWWGEITESNGTVREYLFTEVLLWKRQQAYRKIKEDGITAHSMEITVKQGEMVDGIYNIYDFEFTAFCLINVPPCFPDSALEVFSSGSYQEKFKQMMQELKEINYSVISSLDEVDDTYPQNENSTEGGTMLDAKLELAKEYSIDVESLDFNIEDFSVEELKEKFEAMTAEPEQVGETETETPEPSEEKQEEAGEIDSDEPEEKVESDEEETDPAEDEPEPIEEEAGTGEGATEEFALTGAVVEEIVRSLSTVVVATDWGECRQYCYFDCDFELSEVYCWDITDGFLYGFKYTMDGDNVVIDFESKTRKKFTITDFDEGEQGTQMFQMFEQIKAELAAGADYKAKYESAQTELDTLNAEIVDLRAFKKGIQDEEKETKYSEALAKFGDLEGIDEFDALMENKMEYELDVLVEKCFAIRGRNMANLKFSATPKVPKIKVPTETAEDDPYGGVVEKYKNM